MALSVGNYSEQCQRGQRQRSLSKVQVISYKIKKYKKCDQSRFEEQWGETKKKTSAWFYATQILNKKENSNRLSYMTNNALLENYW